jgi:integrase
MASDAAPIRRPGSRPEPVVTEGAINAATRRAIQSKQRITVADHGQTGLQLRITPAGTRTWVLFCRDADGRPRRFVLGAYPQFGIAQARLAARAMREDVRKGADPIAEARQKRAAARTQRETLGDTLADLLALYARQKGAGLRSWGEYKRRIESVFADSLKTALCDLRVGALQMQADTWPAPQSAAAATRYLRPVLRWAAAPGRAYVAKDLTEITPPAAVRARERVLSRDELAKLLPALAGDAPRDAHATALMFMLLTLARREEAGGATWGEFDLNRATWTLPAARVKSDRTHIVPLSRQTLALLRAMRPENPDPRALVFATSRGTALSNWDRATKRLMLACGLAQRDETQTRRVGPRARGESGRVVMRDGSPLPHRHDLRRTGATLLGELGVEPHVIEAALNHAHIGGQLAALYNRARYRAQVAAALQRLADALDGITARAAVVVPLHAISAMARG